MNEGRKSQIILLDERRLDFLIQPKLFAGDLLDLVASHFKLKEKQYFGLAFIDESLHYHWLQADKRVLDHDIPKKTGVLLLHFSIRFYVDTIGFLRDIQTVELFYFNARQAIFKGHIECDSETVFELAAHVLQASKGDFCSDEEAKEDIKKLPIIPTRTLKEHPSISYCEDRVIDYYRKLLGTSRGMAIVNYMTIVEKLPTYGIHYYEVKDKKEIPWWLGISPKGIAVYDKNDKTTPRKMFTWKNLENLYYRDKKFSIEVHDPKRVSVSRRTFGTSSVNVHAWLAGSQQLTKCIWSMAVAQHQFYLDRKQSKGTLMSARSMSEIAADLCRSYTSLVGSDLSRNSSSQSLPSLTGSRFELNTESVESQKAEREMFQALKARKEALEEAVRKKMEELKILCFQEGELTGQLPKETPLDPGERVPTFRRRVGTSFAISPKTVEKKDGEENRLATLELEYELQSKITSAAHRLAQDKSTSKYVRKQRRQSYNKAAAKLKDMEKKLMEARTNNQRQQQQHAHDRQADEQSIQSGDISQQHWDSRPGLPPDRSATLPPHPPSYQQHQQQQQQHHQPHQEQYQQQQYHHQSPAPSLSSPTHLPLSPSHSSPHLSSQGYQPSSVYDTRTQYRSQMYPTLSSSSSRNTMSPSSSSLSPASVRSLQEDVSSSSVGSSSNNLYNVSLQQTSHYESTDMLQSPASASDLSAQHKLHLPSKHGSLDRAYKRGDNTYGSLDRKKQRQRERQHGYSVEPRGGSGDQGTPPLHLDINASYKPGGFNDKDYPSRTEIPVYHDKTYHGGEQGGWDASLSSPKSGYGRGYDSYSPRLTESAPAQPRQAWAWEDRGEWGVQQIPVHHQPYQQQSAPQSPLYNQPHTYTNPVPVPVVHLQSQPPARGGHSPQPVSPTPPPPAQSTLVTVTRLKPHMEVTKPYETSDFFKYSERLRKQRIIDNYQRQLMGGLLDRSGASTPSQSSDSDSHSCHSGSSLSHPRRLAAASAAYFAATGSPARSDVASSRTVSGLPPVHPHYHRQDSDQSTRTDYTASHDDGSYVSRGDGAPYTGVVSSEFQTMRSQGPATHIVHAQGQSSHIAQSHSSYRSSYMQAVASAKHSHYQPPAPMTCRPVTGQSHGKDSQSK